MNYEYLSEFEKDFKKLQKRFRTLQEDFKLMVKLNIELYHINKIDNNSSVKIESCCTENIISYKIKKFACKSLKNKGSKTGLRVIYAYVPKEKKVVFIEIYYKGDKENEDRTRLETFLNK